MNFKSLLVPALCLALASCGNGDNEKDGETTGQAAEQQALPKLNVPAFQQDTAYTYVATQVAFGPRVPGTPAQRKCADWIEERLNATCDTVYRQETKVKA